MIKKLDELICETFPFVYSVKYSGVGTFDYELLKPGQSYGKKYKSIRALADRIIQVGIENKNNTRKVLFDISQEITDELRAEYKRRRDSYKENKLEQ